MTSIFVAKLDFNATEDQLKSLFEEYGRVNRITIAKDRETGKPRGFAFVEMADESEADQAIQALDNYVINGRNIAVKKADDRASGGKPSGGDNRSGDRPSFKSDRPREDRSNTNEYKSDYKKPEERTSKPAFTSPDDIIPAKVERKKEKDAKGLGGSVSKDAPKKPKMEAYRKSGKDNQFLDDDDLSDEELDLFGRNEEEEIEEDYRKYLVNSDDDSDEDYDDEDEYDDEDYDDEDYDDEDEDYKRK
ncbi:RNA-binding protein [uncultured Fluviicola sp.]|uniref:RNA recognition motif domain-containing protein n=1 Tax=uncultured Fluviicola sp. TaxID=463303 RepID=UPI0025DABB2E|nr:RNA-binding protein [uncultured Fluviicola sp.]